MRLRLRVARAFVRVAGLLVSGRRRREWRREWLGEIHAAYRDPDLDVVELAGGAFPDALAVRSNRRRRRETGGNRRREGGATMETLIRELRFAARNLTRNPGFTAVASGTLALGIGAAVAIFTVVDGVLLEALPYPASERLVSVYHSMEGDGFEGEWPVTHHTYLLFRDENRVFREVGGYVPQELSVVVGETARREAVAEATPGL